MREIPLRPFRNNPRDYDEIEEQIVKLIRKEIYEPLIEELAVKKFKNSIEDLIDAISSGRITFHRGIFTGKFTVSISRELKSMGAKFEPRVGWKINISSLPPSVSETIRSSESKFERILSNINNKLSKILPEEIAEKLNVKNLFDKTLWKIDKEFHSSVKGLSVPVELTRTRRSEIAEQYTNNMKLYIKDWTEKEIVSLRKKVQNHIFAGNRYESMVKIIKDSYGIGQRKAKFLARQETNLLLAKFKTARYTDSGITHYKWRSVSGTSQHPVRIRHKELNDQSNAGKLFRFDDPPRMEDGNRKNPGEDYNCRCVAVPIVRF